MAYIEILDAEVAPEAPITTSLMTRLRDNALGYMGAPTGTITISGTTSAPLGWSNLADHDNKAIRVIGGATAVGSGGSSSFSTVFGKTATDEKTLATANLPSHTHNIGGSTGTGSTHNHNFQIFEAGAGSTAGPLKTATGGNGQSINVSNENNHTHSNPSATQSQGSSTPFTIGIDLRVQYVDVKRIQKS